MTIFQLEALGGPWGRRLARRRAAFGDLPWSAARDGLEDDEIHPLRIAWTQSTYSEYASAASFAEIASTLLAAGAPIDLSAAAGDFVVDEIVHAELCARVANALGGAVPLDADLTRLVRPATAAAPLLRAAELIVRTSCVGEALTVPVLRAQRDASLSPLIAAVLSRLVRDESHHAQLGWWFLDWAADRLTPADLGHLSGIACEAIRSFAPLFSTGCVACEPFDATVRDALLRRVRRPLEARGIRTEPCAW